jgi:hypothetical protein
MRDYIPAAVPLESERLETQSLRQVFVRSQRISRVTQSTIETDLFAKPPESCCRLRENNPAKARLTLSAGVGSISAEATRSDFGVVLLPWRQPAAGKEKYVSSMPHSTNEVSRAFTRVMPTT